jgi:hypothetical protein
MRIRILGSGLMGWPLGTIFAPYAAKLSKSSVPQYGRPRGDDSGRNDAGHAPTGNRRPELHQDPVSLESSAW